MRIHSYCSFTNFLHTFDHDCYFFFYFCWIFSNFLLNCYLRQRPLPLSSNLTETGFGQWKIDVWDLLTLTRLRTLAVLFWWRLMWTSCMMEHFLLETLIVDQLQVVAVVKGVPYVDVVVVDVVQVVPYVDDGFVVAVDDDVV